MKMPFGVFRFVSGAVFRTAPSAKRSVALDKLKRRVIERGNFMKMPGPALVWKCGKCGIIKLINLA